MKSRHISLILFTPMRLLIAPLLCLTLLPQARSADDLDAQELLRNEPIANYKGYGEFKMAKYESARRIWEILATRGNPDALFNLAILAEDGLGEPKDAKKAIDLYTAAANAGGFKAQYRLGLLYSDGAIVPRDLDKARHYLGLAAANGNRDAIDKLASLGQPEGELTDYQRAELLASRGKHGEAADLYRRLAGDGHVGAQTRLAWIYEAGRGVERSLEEAARLFTASAEKGDPEAQYAIAVMYRTGRGKPKDIPESERWMQLSANQGYPAARSALAGRKAMEN